MNADWDASSGDAEILNKPTTLAGYGITDAYTKTESDNLLSEKVDKETGKGLSTNDYTTTEKEKLSGIETGAQVNTVDSVNAKIGAVALNASDIPADGIGDKTVTGASPLVVTDALAAPAHGLKVTLEPKQDLHGYDHPWPAGGGKNLFGGEYGVKWFFPNPLVFNTGDVLTFSASIPASDSTRVALYNGENGNNRIWNAGMNETVNGRRVRVLTITENVTITAILFDNAECTDMQMEIGSTATAYAPYENICPITGFDDVTVKRTGKNLLNPTTIENIENFTVADGVATNSNVDAKGRLDLRFTIMNGSNQGSSFSPDQTFVSVGRITAAGIISEPCTGIRVRHPGNVRNLSIFIPWTTEGAFTLSFYVVSNDIATVDGLML